MEIQVVQLCDLLHEFGEESVERDLLADFSCPLNKDVETFLKDKAILYEKMGKSRSYIVLGIDGDIMKFIAYFALTSRPIQFDEKLSNKAKKKILGTKFEANNEISGILIGQLAKNFSNKNNILITGKELFELAIHKVLKASQYIGGRVVYLECENNPNLRNFYENMELELYTDDKGDPILSETGLLIYIKSMRNIVLERKQEQKWVDRIKLMG